MTDRRTFLGTAAGAGAALALSPELLRALGGFRQTGGKILQRAIPSTGEMLPVISLDPAQETKDAEMKEILKALVDAGGKVIDFPHGGGETVARTAAAEMGIQDKLFWTTSLNVRTVSNGTLLPGAIQKLDPSTVRSAV